MNAARWLESAPPGTLVPVEWIREHLDELVDQTPEIVTTAYAERRWSYSQDQWARWARAGEIPGAWQDCDGGMWRLPFASCVRKLEALRSPTPTRRRRKPWSASENK